MDEIKSNILQRLSRTKELNQTLLKLKENHLTNITEEQNHIIKYKNQENLRAFKQTDLLIHLQSKQFHSQSQLKDFYLISVQICSFYDSEYQIFLDQIDEFNMDHIQRLYVAFFAQHGIKRRSRQIASFLKKTYNDVNPAIYLGWMIEWSRIKYCEVLDSIQTFYRQMKIIMNKQRRIQQKINHIQEQAKFQNKKEAEIQKKKIISFNLKIENNKIDSALPQQKKNIYLFNKDSVCSYFVDQLTQYYRNLNLQDLDMNYLKCIKKQGKKQDLFVAQNMNKTLQFLLQNKNKEQKLSILKYESEFKKSKVGAKIIEESLKITSQRKQQTQRNNSFKQKNYQTQNQVKASYTEYMNLTNSPKRTFIRLSKTHKFMKQKISDRSIKVLQQIQEKSVSKNKDEIKISNKKQKQMSIIRQRQNFRQKQKQTLNTNYMIEFPHIQRLKKQKEDKDKIIISSQNNQKGKRRIKRQSILGDQFYVVPAHQASRSTKLPESIKLSKARESDGNLINQQEFFVQTRSFSKDSLIYNSSGKSSLIRNPEGSDKKQIKLNFKLNQTKIDKKKQSQKSLLYKILGHTPNFDDKDLAQNRKNTRQISQKLNQQRQLAVLKKLRKKMQIKGVIIREMSNLVIQ